MKSSTSSSSSATGKFTSSSSTKSKKTSKDREKRKSQSTSDNQHNSEKGSPNKDGSARKYAGYGPEQLAIMAEQSILEHLTEEVSVAFTEDINYKLRQLIYDAVTRARLCGRNSIISNDIDEALECLQVEKVYGAPCNPEWHLLTDHHLYYLDDAKISLIELAEETQSFVQPLEPILTWRWLPEAKEITKSQRNYFMLMCQAVVNPDRDIRVTALKDIRENRLIGPLIEWFYHFGYFLLSKDITYDSLTLLAFDLIEALELSPISSYMVSEKQIMLLARLLLQRLLRSVTITEILRPMCRILGKLCVRIPVRRIILKKIVGKFPEVREDFALPIICAANELGVDAIYAIIVPHLHYFFATVAENQEQQPEAIYEILRTYNILSKMEINNQLLFDQFFNAFGDGLVQLWRDVRVPPDDSSKTHSWLNIKTKLLKTRRKIAYTKTKPHETFNIQQVFPEDDDDEDDENSLVLGKIKMEIFDDDFEDIFEEPPVVNEPKSIVFKFLSFKPAVGRSRFLNSFPYQYNKATMSPPLIIGKSTLLAPVLRNSKHNDTYRCLNHTLMYHYL